MLLWKFATEKLWTTVFVPRLAKSVWDAVGSFGALAQHDISVTESRCFRWARRGEQRHMACNLVEVLTANPRLAALRMTKPSA